MNICKTIGVRLIKIENFKLSRLFVDVVHHSDNDAYDYTYDYRYQSHNQRSLKTFEIEFPSVEFYKGVVKFFAE